MEKRLPATWFDLLGRHRQGLNVWMRIPIDIHNIQGVTRKRCFGMTLEGPTDPFKAWPEMCMSYIHGKEESKKVKGITAAEPGPSMCVRLQSGLLH